MGTSHVCFLNGSFAGTWGILGESIGTVDGRTPAPPKKPWKNDLPSKYHQTMIFVISKRREKDFVHPPYFNVEFVRM